MKTYKQLYDESVKTRSLKSLTPVYFKWEKKSQMIVGAYISQNRVTSRLGETGYNQYIFETDKGLVKFALGRAADSEYAEAFVRGVVYAVTYEGQEKISGGRSVNRFTVDEVGISDAVDDAGKEPATDDSTVDKK